MMEKGKRYAQSRHGEFVEDSSGYWLYDPDKEMISRDVAIAANARADCYEEQIKDLARGIDERNTKLLADLIVAQEKIDFLEKQVTDLDAFLQEKKKEIENVRFERGRLRAKLGIRNLKLLDEKTAFAGMLSELLKQWRKVANKRSTSVREANTLFTTIADLEELIESWESNNG